MWELYKLIGKGMGKDYLIDEIHEKLKTLPEHNFKQSLKIMYDKPYFENPAQLALLFINGLKVNNFFEFQRFVEILNGN